MAAEAGKKKSKTLVIVLVFVMIVLLGLGGLFIFNQIQIKKEMNPETPVPTTAHSENGLPPIITGNVCLNNSIFIENKTAFIANLKSEANGQKYVAQVQMIFEVCQDKDLEAEFNRITPIIENDMLLLLREKTAQELNGREGAEQLILQALEVVRQAMPKQYRNGIRNVLLKKFVVSATN